MRSPVNRDLCNARVYAGTTGGVFKSTDGGASWQAATTGLPISFIPALAIDPLNPATVYAGTFFGGGVFKSTDGGASWQPMNSGLTNLSVLALAIDPLTPATVYAGNNSRGVFKSTDGGASWQPTNAGLTNTQVHALAIDPLNPAKLYAGTDGGGVFKITFSDVGPPPQPVLSVTPPPSLDFGTVTVGMSGDLTFTATNTGAGTLTGTASTSAPFSIVSGGSFSLAAGASQVVVVGFSPTATDSFSGNVNFTSNGGDVSHVVTGTGEAAPAISVAPTTLDFGSVAVGSSADLTFTIQNAGGGTLSGTVNAIAPFSIVSGNSFELAAGQSQIVTVRFTPTSVGSATGGAALISNAAGSPHTVDLLGAGTQALAAITLSTDRLIFGTQIVGTTSTSKTVTVTNSGSGQLVIGTLRLTGINVSDFALRRNSCNRRTLAPNSSCSFDVRFASSATGERTASVTIPSNAVGNPHLVVLSGVGAAEKVLLLLHGMNSDPSTWDAFVFDTETFPNCPIILGSGVRFTDAIPNSRGVLCYRLMFGHFDVSSGRPGLPDPVPITATPGSSGDFETFEQLGEEVRNAVQAVLNRHPQAGIVLLGHSRGGIAARMFLQEETYTERLSVIGLLTTGTPHKGSRLGRIYEYLGQHLRATCSNTFCQDDWEVVDVLRESPSCNQLLGGSHPKLDVRRPTINDLSDKSDVVEDLNNAIGELPTDIKYGQITYRGLVFGILGIAFNLPYSVFDRPRAGDICQQVSQEAEMFILEGNNPDNFHGDGIVPAESQRYFNISGFPGIPRNRVPLAFRKGILHIEEPEQQGDICEALISMVGAWCP